MQQILRLKVEIVSLALWWVWGQSYKDFYTCEQIYKTVLKCHNMLWLRKYLARLLGCYTLKYSWSFFSLRGTISNLGTLFYTTLRLKSFIGLAPDLQKCLFLPGISLLVLNQKKSVFLFEVKRQLKEWKKRIWVRSQQLINFLVFQFQITFSKFKLW